jgi:hypothetical protein
MSETQVDVFDGKEFPREFLIHFRNLQVGENNARSIQNARKFGKGELFAITRESRADPSFDQMIPGPFLEVGRVADGQGSIESGEQSLVGGNPTRGLRLVTPITAVR